MAPQTSTFARTARKTRTALLGAALLLAACSHGGGSSTRLLSIAVTPTNPSIATGTTAQFVAIGTYSNTLTRDVTAQAMWSSSDPSVSISNVAGSVGLASGVSAGSATISATFAGVTGSTGLTVTSATLVTIEVTPSQPAIALGTSCPFAATGVFSDGTTQDLTDQAVWDTSDPALVSVSNAVGLSGVATGVGVGTATVTATFGGISGSADLEVTSAVLVILDVTPVDPAIALGTAQQFTATGIFSDGTTQDLTTQAAWESSSAAAAVSNSAPEQGLAQSSAIGSATITATVSGISGTSTLTVTSAALVSMAITPTNPSIALGTQQPFTATGTFTDATVQDLSDSVTWSSSSEEFAAVSNAAGSRGLASSVAVGQTTITASLSGVSGSTTLTVSSAALVSIEVTPSAPSVALGLPQSFVATGTYTDGSTQDLTDLVTWASASGAVASVSNADGSRGLATSLGVGSSSISATLDGISGSTTLAVTAAVLVSLEVSPDGWAIPDGLSLSFTALGVFSDGSRLDLTSEATWETSDGLVAKVSNAADSAGLVKALSVGAVTVSASLSGTTGSAALDVTDAILVEIDVLPFTPSLANGTELQFVAVGTYSDESSLDLTSQVAWSLSDGAVAAVSNADGSRGLATGLSAGATTVTATFSGLSGSADLTVTNAVLVSIAVDPANPSVQAGETHAFVATGTFSDASTQDLTEEVTWSSSAPSIAAVSNAAGSRGVATGLSAGTATISASFDGQSGSTTMNVTALTLLSVDVEPVGVFLPQGYSIRLEATGNYSDGSSADITQDVVWTSSATQFATVSNAAGTEGRVTGIAAGTANLTATLSGVSGLVLVTVTNESLVDVTVDPDPVTMNVGETLQLTAWGEFSLGTILDITNNVRWSSNDKFDVSVNNTTQKGLVTARRTGGATIKAKKGNRQGTTDVTVN